MYSSDDVDLIEKKTLYKGFFSINGYKIRHKLFNGGYSPEFTRELFERGHAVAVLPYDPATGEVVFVEQFRIGAYAAGAEPWMIEPVAGIVEEGETPEDVARREAKEEAGIELSSLRFVSTYFVSPGGTSETISLFVATTDAARAAGVHGLACENEDIRVLKMRLDEALLKIDTGEICNATTIIALLYLAAHKDEFRKPQNSRSDRP